jgi:hypothetical protein
MNSKQRELDQPWSTDDMAFKEIKPGSLGYAMLTKEGAVRSFKVQPATLMYDSLALRYNQCEPEDLLIVSLPNRPTTSNMRKNLRARGLSESDYRLFRPMLDEHGNRYHTDRRPLVIQRLTAKEMHTLQPYQATAAQLAREAEQRGVTHNFELPKIPVKSGLSEPISAGNQDLVHTEEVRV